MPNYRIVKTWNDTFAEYEYRLEVISRIGIVYNDTGHTGDEDWANRQASHYNCKIVDDPDA